MTKINYIHTFRGIAILFVVAAHIIWNAGDYIEIKKGIQILLFNPTIFFVIISGFLFEYLSPKYGNVYDLLI
jgi:peptidoglycan/LPS O-acetylase OafA/YrhL